MSSNSEVPPHTASTFLKPPNYIDPQRNPSLDVIRGIGILGALFISIWIFGGFSTNEQTGLLLRSKGLNYRLFGTVDILLEGKMRGLVAMIFGAGMILFLSRQNEEGKPSTADYFIRRQFWLMLFGLINGIVFLWTGDMLFHLAVMGVLLFPFVRLSKRSLLIASLVVMLIYCGKIYWNYSDDRKTYNKYLAVVAAEKKIRSDSADVAKKDSVAKAQLKDTSLAKKTDTSAVKTKIDTLTKKQNEEKGAWEGRVAGMKYDPKKDDGEKKQMRSTSYGKLWNHLLGNTQYREAAWTYQTGIWEFAVMIFLGMALLKFGFFNAAPPRSTYLLLALGGITAGLLLGWLRLHNQQMTLQDYAKYIDRHWFPHRFFFPLEVASLALGYASLVQLLIGTGTLNRLWRCFAYVGRMALSNYLLQSIICTIFFTGFGMGYYARLSQYQLYLLVAEISLVQIVFSVLWLRHYQHGPAEWLLRCLVYKKWLKNSLHHTTVEGSTAAI